MPRGADGSWVQKLYKQHLKKQHFSKPRLSQTAFIVHHFADDVEYEVTGFVEKNRDVVNQEHLAILKASEVSDAWWNHSASLLKYQNIYAWFSVILAGDDPMQDAFRNDLQSTLLVAVLLLLSMFFY